MNNASKNSKQYNELQERKISKLIEIGEIIHWMARNNQVNQNQIVALSKEICEIDGMLYSLEGSAIPGDTDGLCPGCKCGIQENTVFCSYCGINVKEFYSSGVVKCSVCGNSNKTGSKYCSACGSRV